MRVFLCHHQIKKRVSINTNMTNPLDETLDAFQGIEDAIVDVKTKRNVMTDKIMIEDYDKILSHLEMASENLINAIVIFQRHEKSL